MRAIIFAIAAAGWGLVLYSTMLIDHLDLFGLRQVWLFYLGRKYTPVEFRESVIYRWLRHPLMLGFVIAFWATPDMTVGHLLFAVVTTAYILFGIQIEEKTLLALHGDDYREYRKRVSMIVPRPPRWG
jgi:protein-S-isoprenylcysteine O-methyltransferase Ste14